MNAMTIQSTTLPRRNGTAPAARERRRRRRLSESAVLFLVFAVLYLAVAVLLVQHNILFADAMSRVGNAYYVLFSRDPHLPAIGFVWNPLPSLVLLPILPLKSVAPWLVTYGFAGAIESALLMAGTVALLAGCLRKLRVPRAPRLVITVLFAVQPMILLYAGSGLSEAMMLFFLMLTTSVLISWLQNRSPGALVGAGLALGLTYMARYEAIAPAFGVTVLVGIVTWTHTRGGTRSARLAAAVNDIALVAGPFVFAFALWSAMARVLVGQWLPTFSSTYGNSAQVSSGAQSIQSVTGDTAAATLEYIGRQIQGLAPLFVVLLVAAAVLAVRARNLPAVAAPVVLGAVSAFNALVLLKGSSFGWLRFQISVIPLTALLAGTVVGLGLQEARRRGRSMPQGDRTAAAAARTVPGRRSVAVVGTVLVAAAVAVSIPVQMSTLTNTQTGLAREESPMLHSAISPDLATNEERRSLLIFQTERQIAAYIDNLDPGDGAVLTDTAYAYPVVMASTRPRQFVITSDLDFTGAVADPAGHHVKYLLVPAPELGPADALQTQWPGLYQNGAGISTLVQTFPGAFFGDWRLYRVN